MTENVVHAEPKGRDPMFGALLFSNATSMVSVFFENALRAEDALPIKLQLGQELPEVNFVIPERQMHSITGKIIAAKDRFPVRGATLKIKRVGEKTAVQLPDYLRLEQGTKTDREGRFEFKDLPKGKYSVSVEPGSSEFDREAQAYGVDPDEPPDWSAARPSNATFSARTNANSRGVPAKAQIALLSNASKEFVVDDEDLTDQVVELSTGATIIGTVASQHNEALSGTVALTARSEGSDVEKSHTTSFVDYSEEGEKRRKLTQKDFRFSGITPGKTYFTVKTDDDDYYVKSAMSNQVDLLAGRVELKSGETLANMRIVLANDTGTLKGKLIDDEKQPLVGRTITFIPTEKAKSKNSTFHREVRTDASGEFEIKLPPFEYAVIIYPKGTTKPQNEKWLESALRDAEKVQIDAGQTSTITIKRSGKD